MLYRHDTENCFASAIGDQGLSDDEFASVLDEAATALENIKADYRSGALPMLSLAEAKADLEGLKLVAERCRRDFDNVVVLGTGGSSLGGHTLCSLADIGFGPEDGSPRIYFIDNVDPNTFETLFGRIGLVRTGFIVISKSGGTAETVAQFVVCLDALNRGIGKAAVAEQVIVITEPGDNPLRRLASKWGTLILDHDPEVGGRYSVLSLVGLLPAMIAGLDAAAVRAGAADVLMRAMEANAPGDCEAAVGAAIGIGLLRHHGAASTVLMPYADRLSIFGLWFQQLWAESLGKDGTGTTPIRAMGTRDQHSQMQLYLDGPRDKMFTLVMLDVADSGRPVCSGDSCDEALDYLTGRSMGDLLAAEQTATAATLAANGCPIRVITIQELNEKTLGGLLMHFMLETMVAARLLGINAFDQPAVEEGKDRTRRYLANMRLPK